MMNRLKDWSSITLAFVLMAPFAAQAQTSLAIKDANNSAQTVKTNNCSGTICPLSVLYSGDGTVISSSNPLNIDNRTIVGTTIDTNSGTKSAGTQRIVIATDQPVLTNSLPVNITQVAGATAAANNGTASAQTLRVTVASDSTGQVALTSGSKVQTVAGTTGGGNMAHTLSTTNNNSTNVKASAGTLYQMSLINTTTTLYYLKLYDKATAPTCASDTVQYTVPVPFGATNAGGGTIVSFGDVGAAFAAGIGFCLTGGIADNDNTSAVAGIVISTLYK